MTARRTIQGWGNHRYFPFVESIHTAHTECRPVGAIKSAVVSEVMFLKHKLGEGRDAEKRNARKTQRGTLETSTRHTLPTFCTTVTHTHTSSAWAVGG